MTARRPLAPWLFLLAGLAVAYFLAEVAWNGRDYYRLGETRRPLHPRHAELRSSGTLGLACGIGATALFLLNLGYLARKRLAGVSWMGSLRSWMAFHIFTGLAGAGLVAIHGAFLPRSALGIFATACLGIVVLSGVLGRWIHAHVPRTLEGREMESEELRAVLRDHHTRLRGMGVELPLLSSEPPPRRGLLGRLLGILVGDRRLRAEWRRLRKSLRGRKDLGRSVAEILPVARQFCRERHWLARYGELRGLMDSWRFLHRWLAVLMLAVLLFHIALALRYAPGLLG